MRSRYGRAWVGVEVGAGVASGVERGRRPSGRRRLLRRASAAGRSTACSSSSSISWYGPLPTGDVANGLVARSANGTSESRWAGSSGWVAAARKPRDRRRDLELDGPGVDGGRGDVRPGAGHGARGSGVLERLDGVHDVVGRHRLAVLPHRVVAEGEGPGLALLVGRPRLGEIGLVGVVGSEPDEAAEDEPDERPLGPGPREDRHDRLGHADDALAVRGRGRQGGLWRRLRGGRRCGRRQGDDATEDDERQDEDDDDRVVAAGDRHVRRATAGGGRARCLRLGYEVGGETNATSANTMNSTSRTIVNCHRRRSMPRRLR